MRRGENGGVGGIRKWWCGIGGGGMSEKVGAKWWEMVVRVKFG